MQGWQELVVALDWHGVLDLINNHNQRLNPLDTLAVIKTVAAKVPVVAAKRAVHTFGREKSWSVHVSVSGALREHFD